MSKWRKLSPRMYRSKHTNRPLTNAVHGGRSTQPTHRAALAHNSKEAPALGRGFSFRVPPPSFPAEASPVPPRRPFRSARSSSPSGPSRSRSPIGCKSSPGPACSGLDDLAAGDCPELDLQLAEKVADVFESGLVVRIEDKTNRLALVVAVAMRVADAARHFGVEQKMVDSLRRALGIDKVEWE